MSYRHGNGRIQARGAGGRFRQWTGEEFGIGVCPKCQTITTRPQLPDTRPIDPVDFRARVCAGCGWDSRKPEVALEEKKDPDVGGQAMVYLGGSKSCFRCPCGCNVFTRLEGSKYRCNSCNETYTAE